MLRSTICNCNFGEMSEEVIQEEQTSDHLLMVVSILIFLYLFYTNFYLFLYFYTGDDLTVFVWILAS